MPAPMRPLATSPVMMGPISLTSEYTIMDGRNAFAPNRVKVSRVCSERTTPVAAPANATSGIDFEPAASIWRRNSPHSNGSVNRDLATRRQNTPSSPNHSSTPVNKPDIGWCFGAGRACLPIAAANYHDESEFNGIHPEVRQTEDQT